MSKSDKLISALKEELKNELREQIKAELRHEYDSLRRVSSPWDEVKRVIVSIHSDEKAGVLHQTINSYSVLLRRAFNIRHISNLNWTQVDLAVFMVKEIAKLMRTTARIDEFHSWKAR